MEAQRGDTPTAPEAADQVLLYDGTCGFCAASVQFILRHERRRNLRFAPLQGRWAADLRGRHPELEGVDSMVWVDDAGLASEAVEVRSRAVLKAAGYLGSVWGLARIGWLVPASIGDRIYDVVARHRHAILRAPDMCYVPAADARTRFLD